MYDDNSAGAVVVGEEFEINTQVAGQVWAVTFTDNGTAFFSGNVLCRPAGGAVHLRELTSPNIARAPGDPRITGIPAAALP